MDQSINSSDPLANPVEFKDVIELVSREALVYLEGLDTRQMRSPDSDAVADSFAAQLPEEGDGAVAALSELLGRGLEATVTSAGPRFFHWVIGGSTPAPIGSRRCSIRTTVGGMRRPWRPSSSWCRSTG